MKATYAITEPPKNNKIRRVQVKFLNRISLLAAEKLPMKVKNDHKNVNHYSWRFKAIVCFTLISVLNT
jgi:hypothetical protein